MLYYPFYREKERSSVGLITVLSNQCFTTESLREVFLAASYYGTLLKWIASYLGISLGSYFYY